jgi:hypothetical protein
MYKFKTKYKSIFNAIDELQYVRQGESAPNPFKDNAPRRKEANYNFSIVSPVSGGKYIPINVKQLTGKGVSNKADIYNKYESLNNDHVDGFHVFGKIEKFSKRRLFKRDNVIYDLTF